MKSKKKKCAVCGSTVKVGVDGFCTDCGVMYIALATATALGGQVEPETAAERKTLRLLKAWVAAGNVSK